MSSSLSWSYRTTISSSLHQTQDNNQVITIPFSGYYTLSFGTKSHLEDFETLTPDLAKESDVVYCGCQFLWTFCVEESQLGHRSSHDVTSESSTHAYDHDAQEISLILPLIFNTHSKSKKFITSTRIAHVIYVSKGTTFQIHTFQRCGSSNSRTSYSTLSNDDSNGCSGPFECSLQLYIPHESSSHSQMDDNREHDAESSDLKRQKSNPFDFHPKSFSKKPWVCVQCRRCFQSPKATRNHCTSTHANPNDEVMDYSDLIGPKIFHIPLQSVYEDDDIVIVNKPQGIPVQSGRWTIHNTDLLLPFRAKPG